MIAATRPCGFIGRLEQGIDLRPYQIVNSFMDAALAGMAKTRWIGADWAGNSNAAKRKNERIAVNRRFRLRVPTPRRFWRSSRNELIRGRRFVLW